MSDLNLRKFILEELEFQPDIDAANIGVTVENGVVTLTGHVNSYAQKISAERAVKAIKGVRALAEEIQVRLEKGAGTADDTIANRALNILNWSSDVPEGDIKIMVQNGWITLEGEVDWQYQKETAERAVRKLSGVVGVDNQLTLRPRVDAGDIRQRIEQALKRNAEIDAKAIHIKVDGDVVKLEGKVHLWRERQIAERAAWSVPGVRKVDDHLLIA
ncbi:BON domain-containing protein [Pseudomonas chlororaphis]|uniref:BON domain-containing protein n=1 Tax=Pseudomonas chlororaphis TaxID=587753 RepID=UPI0006A57CAA|nr:BON domain-containing protein [Pseudomonas chlororaphis]AZD02329.1 transport-associated protein [Pseudomonas chlororaphis subsp. chlororaphis]MBM0280384.1 BON domain-containing protein [Pseudomonas chlororaphis]MDO1504976.1 BON domain-containing protein [Pseudomonas chlororaphis]ORM44862.1 ornithine aminotransferase [Pseudomonas chlororaphis subsp. chlororaphis]TWR96095.1 BON domain-containing protein [Pseudomonas chlororaphis subsp. chlororaphis]